MPVLYKPFIHSVAFASESGHIVSCSDDMTIGVVRYA